MVTLNLSCPCGATLAYIGNDGYAGARHSAFTKDHAGHEVAAVAAQVEELATVSAHDVDTVADLVKAITTQIDAAARPRICEDPRVEKVAKGGRVYVLDRETQEVYGSYPEAVTTAAGNHHLEVLMGPGETITIRTDPARVEGHPGADPMTVLHGRLVVGGPGDVDGTWMAPHLRLDTAYPVKFSEEV